VETLPEVTKTLESLALKPSVTPAPELPAAVSSATDQTVFLVSGMTTDALAAAGLKPVLLAERGGALGQKFVLVAKEGVSAASLSGHRVAMRQAAPELKGALEAELLTPAGLKWASLTPLEVSKTTDALMAVRMGQVDAAVVDATEFEQVVKAVPAAFGSLKALATSPELVFGALSLRAGSSPSAEIEQLTAALSKRTGAVAGGADRWVVPVGRP
jgi:hypothetical protein